MAKALRQMNPTLYTYANRSGGSLSMDVGKSSDAWPAEDLATSGGLFQVQEYSRAQNHGISCHTQRPEDAHMVMGCDNMLSNEAGVPKDLISVLSSLASIVHLS